MTKTKTKGEPYQENEDHQPNPTDQYGTLDTSATAGAAHGRIEEVTPVFDEAKSKEAVNAQRALDPDDPGVPESAVVLPGDLRDNEAARKVIEKRAKAASKEDQKAAQEEKKAAKEEEKSDSKSSTKEEKKAASKEEEKSGSKSS